MKRHLLILGLLMLVFLFASAQNEKPQLAVGLFEDILPFWLNHAIDWEDGGFTFCLNRDGSILDTDKGVWQTARFSWMILTLYNEVENGIVTIHTAGNYEKLKASFTICVDAHGVFQIDYSVKHSIKDQTIQEAGLKFITGSAFETLAWNRNPYFTAYPEGALGAAKGEVSLADKPEMNYREEPHHPWEYDSKGFYYFGLEKELSYTNLVRSLKENIYSYSLTTETNSEIKLFSRGNQACRFDQIDGDPTLIVNDQWVYNSLLWGNYMKKLPLNDQIEGRVTMAIKYLR